MKILLISVGTQGDIEPFVAIGEKLKKEKHHVLCAFPEQFKSIAEEAGLKFASLGTKYIELLESPDGKMAMGGGKGFHQFLSVLRLAFRQRDANRELVQNQFEIVKKEKPDRIIYNGKSVYPVLWEIKNPGKTVFQSPIPYMHYVKGHSHVAFNRNLGEKLNKLSFSIANFGLVSTILVAKRWLNISAKIKRKEIRQILQTRKSVYTISPALFKRPDYWPQNLQVIGFYHKSMNTDWKPNTELNKFLNKHDKILFITFGSMINPNPKEKSRIIMDILESNQIPAIINPASGGLIKPEKYDPGLIHFVSQIPYDWILPKMYGVIHHGGSGTTQLSLKYGCASLIIPHIIDQFVWNTIVSNLGAGPKGVKIGKLKAKHA